MIRSRGRRSLRTRFQTQPAMRWMASGRSSSAQVAKLKNDEGTVERDVCRTRKEACTQ